MAPPTNPSNFRINMKRLKLSSMKKAEIFIYFTILLITAGVLYKFQYYGFEQSPFLLWMAVGGFLGAIYGGLRAQSKRGLHALAFGTFGLILFLGAYLVQLSFDFKRTQEDVKNWPSAQARIQTQNIYEMPPTKIRPTDGRWAATWSYQFNLNDKTYVSHSKSAIFAYVLSFKKSESLARQDLQRHPIGSVVEVYYNPKNPEETTMEKPQPDPSEWMLSLFLGSFLMFLSMLATYLAQKKTITANETV